MFERQLSSVFEDDETKLGRMGISERVTREHRLHAAHSLEINL